MNTGNYNISTLAQVVYEALSGISKNTFLLQRPKSTDKMNEFIVIDLPNRVYDNMGYGETRCVIELYAKERANMPNMPLLSSLQEKIYERLPIDSEQCKVHSPVSHMIGPDGLGFHVLTIYCNVLIK